jgi:DNA-binding NarL/FixJ family response regulator
MGIRVLLVDDHESWRRYVSAALRKLQYQVVGEAVDGLEAVQKAETLNPDLTVLDIGLPTLNGIQVARRIRAHTPDAKILFVSGHRSHDIAEAALGTGAGGYVLKADAGLELRPAIEAIMKGQRYVSAAFADSTFARVTGEPIAKAPRRHEVQFCPDEASLLNAYAAFTESALTAGTAVIVVSTSARRDSLRQKLQARGLNLELAIEEGRYQSLDAADALSAVMVNGWPDETRFWTCTTTLFEIAAKASKGASPRVAACGDCAPKLWREGKAAAAVRLEHLWDEFTRVHDVDVLCGYSVELSLPDHEGRIFQQICAEHSAVHPR